MSRRLISLCAAFMVVCWCLSVRQILAISRFVQPIKEANSALGAKVTTKELGGSDRYQTFVSTDKPIYRANESVYVRGVMLNATTHEPLTVSRIDDAIIQIKGPKHDVIASASVQPDNGVWGYKWTVPEEQAGGEYTAYVTYPGAAHPPAERKFDIRAFRAPRLKTQITFLRDGYGPGDNVVANLSVTRAEGGFPQGAKVTVVARVDGTEIKGESGVVDAKGLCSVHFLLPRQIARGEGTLSLVIQDGGVVETAAKTIPILLRTVDLQIFPEGGDLIAGFKNRVYIQANQPNGKPADLEGKLLSKEKGRSVLVTNFRTEHEGRGRFEFTPDARKNYFLSISKPAHISTLYPLPKVKTSGAVIRSDKNIFEKGQPVAVEVGSTTGDIRVSLSKREVEIGSSSVNSKNASAKASGSLHQVLFNVPTQIDGVLTVTVWDAKGVPLAERLIFREPAKPLTITITPDKKSYAPGENAKLTVKATDSNGKPVSATVGLTVADDSILQMVDKREQAPNLPVMLFLEPEVLDLADASVYLDRKNPKAPLATDLLLGTQGWRRFALMNLDTFVKRNGDHALRAVAMESAPPAGNQHYPHYHHVDGGAFLAAPNGLNRSQLKQQPKDAELDMNQIIVRPSGAEPPAPAPKGLNRMMPQAPMNELPGRGNRFNFPVSTFAQEGNKARKPVSDSSQLILPEDNGRVEGPRDTNLFQVEPSRVDERHYTSGRDERHQKVEPFGASFLPPPAMPFMAREYMVREFAHQVRPNRKSSDRVDFTETLYWNSGVKTDSKTGWRRSVLHSAIVLRAFVLPPMPSLMMVRSAPRI